MKAVLNKFTSEHLFDASSALLRHLKIKFTPQSKVAIDFSDLYFNATSNKVPKALGEIIDKIENTFLIAAVDEETLEGRVSDFSIRKPLDGKYSTMLVFGVDVKKEVSFTRTELATLTRGLNRMASMLPVIVIVRNSRKLTLATCERTAFAQNWREGEKLGRVSILRDIDCSNPHRGHIDILGSLGDKAYPTFDDLYNHWLEVFSSELLTKKFYTELSEWYAWAVGSGKVKFPNNINTTEDDAKYNHENVIRLITRLIFVWFLKQKKLIPDEFFNENAIEEKFIENFNPHSEDSMFYDCNKSKYYRLILQNLFFAMLNRPIKDEESGNDENRRFISDKTFQGKNPDHNINNLLRYRSEFKPGGAEELLRLANSQVPFLNGGLFECLDHKDKEDREYGMYYDGFSENKNSLSQLSFPDYFFFAKAGDFTADLSEWYDDRKRNSVKVRGIIDILKSYNFTVEENTPLDQEVSLDPELLGKAFENLLASYNPETNTTARKQTGSFYTPRDIVKYMVDESLTAHLKKSCPAIDESIFKDLFDYSADDFNQPEEIRKSIMSALYNCKVLDPACGSGAFPMGILQQMVHALRKLDPSNDIWREFILNISLKKDEEAYRIEDSAERNRIRSDIEESFNKNINDPDYARKLYLIENCIYGVDIQPIATQISKLRFFISLVAEQKPTSDPASNFGIRPLPNLEAKFVSANTLLELQKESNLFTSTDQLEAIKKNLAEANHKLFRAKNNRIKRTLRKKIENLRKQYSEELVNMGTIGPSSAQLLAEWNMFNQNSAARFFDPEWMFGVNNGFDIVIGNPPYVQLQKATGEKAHDKKGKLYDVKLGDQYEDCHFESFAKTGDIYCLFYEQGYKLVHDGGIVCYITSNKWMRAGYGEKLRGFFAKKTNPQILVDFGGVQVFESATVDTNILIFSKEQNQKSTRCVTIGKERINGFLNLSDFVRQNAISAEFSSSDSWVILSPIELSIKRKIEAVGVPLKDWDINIYRGVLTGYNDAFIISTEKREEILAKCQTEDERKRTEELIRPILRGRDIKRYGYDWAGLWLIATFPSRNYDIEMYPAVKSYLLSFAEGMLRECGLDWIADKYLSEFCYQKLSQTGKYIIIEGKHVRIGNGDEKARKKTSNKWFETQDSISYWDDFRKPKLIWGEISDRSKFAYDFKGRYVPEATTFLLVGEDVMSLYFFLNSSPAEWYFSKLGPRTGEGTIRWKKYTVEMIFAPHLSNIQNLEIVNIALGNDVTINPKKINDWFYKFYGFSNEERTYIEDYFYSIIKNK